MQLFTSLALFSSTVSSLNYLAVRRSKEHRILWGRPGNAAIACCFIVNKRELNPAVRTIHTRELHSMRRAFISSRERGDPGGNGWVILEAVRTEESGWFALQWVWPDTSAGDRYIYSLQGLASPALPWLPLKAIHPHTWIRNEIIYPPPRVLLSQPCWLDGFGHIERARKQIEMRKSLIWWSGTEGLGFRGDYTETCCRRATRGGSNKFKWSSTVQEHFLFCLRDETRRRPTTVFSLNPETLVSFIQLEMNFPFNLPDNISSSMVGWR